MVAETVLERQVPLATIMGDGSVCEQCGKPLVQPHRGQRFCPDPDDGRLSCGRLHSLAVLHAHRASRTKWADNRHAPTAQNVEVYRKAAQTLDGA